MADWNYLDWAEKAAIENLRGRLATGDFLTTHANGLLNILLVGIGAALSFGARVFTPTATPMDWGAAWVAAWLSAVALILVHQCISTRKTPALFNEPKNIYKPDLGLDEATIRKAELDNVQERIEQAKERNSQVAFWLDRCRYAASATPIVFAIGIWTMR